MCLHRTRKKFLYLSILYANKLLSGIDTPALDNLSFIIQPGEKLGVCGRSGRSVIQCFHYVYVQTDISLVEKVHFF
jgi:ABC-type glutathione transport system ATPase component